MIQQLFSRLVILSLCIFQSIYAFSVEENFVLINGFSDEIVIELGHQVEERICPCSTFKVALSLMAYDAGLLIDETNPVWDFYEGYDDYLDSWKDPQTPQSWMRCSCVWYSKVLSLQLDLERIKSYLSSMEYGNQDMSGGLVEPGSTNPPWIKSSLKISPKEQAFFIRKMISGELKISTQAIQMTKELLFKEVSSDGWKMFGKTGYSDSDMGLDGKILESGWFIGWIEKDCNCFPFAYLIRAEKVNLDQRIPRVKLLLLESKVMNGFWHN